jgi:tetratricopeptide (TPR) repeat protein
VAETPPAQQEPAAMSTSVADNFAQRELQAVQEMLALATAEFDGPQQSRSIVRFDEIISRLEGLRRQGTLPPRGREILVQAYELRGRAYYNIGLQEKAADSFTLLVQIQPQYSLSKEKVSPKIVDYFNSVKKALVGYLAVTSQPAGAKVVLTGVGETRDLGLTDFFPLEVLAGDYTVEISREGYRSESRALSIAPRATETVAVDLVRVSASCFFITEPAGVEVWVDGELKTATAGSLLPEHAELARAKGLDPARASARTEIANLSLGSHTVELRKKCHEVVRRTIHVPEPQDYDADPVRMEESLASLRLTSDPPGARIFLDGEALGQTPKELDAVCSGKHRLEVKHASGKFVQDLVLARNESVSLDCPIRPSLAFLGTVAETSAGERFVADAEEKILQNLSRIASLNFLYAPKETVDKVLADERLDRRGLVPASGGDVDAIRKATEKLAEALEVEGFLVAVLPEEKLQRTAVLHLLAAGNTQPDRWQVKLDETASFQRFINSVDQKATVYRSWSGLVTVDTLLHQGVPVLRVIPGSPAAEAGVEAGEILTAADGRSIERTADLLAVVEGKKAREKVGLQLQGPSGARSVELTLTETPQEVPLNDPALLYNKVMMDLRQQVVGYPGTETAAFARLNLALCAMHFADYGAAHEHLQKAKTELPRRPGISQGTAFYYLGLSLEKLGYKKEAVESYRAAAGFKDATLFNNDGPAVESMASRRLGP